MLFEADFHSASLVWFLYDFQEISDTVKISQKELKKNWKSKNFPRHERIPRLNTFKHLLLLEEEKFLIKKKST